MLDHPGVTVRAFKEEPAGPADRQRGIAAAVEEQQRLFPRLKPLIDRPGQRRRDPAAPFNLLLPQIDQAGFRQLSRAEPFRQFDALVLPRLSIRPAFEGGGRGGEHSHRLTQRGPQHRHVAGRIKRAILLLVRPVMLLIDHDQAEVFEGEEQGRPGANHQLGIARRRPDPDAAALRSRDLGVPLSGPRAEPRLNPFNERCSESDFGEEDEGLSPLPHTLRHRLHVNFGLARSGDALQQLRLKPPGGDGGAHDACRRLLSFRKLMADARSQLGKRFCACPLFNDQRARRGEAFDHARRYASRVGDLSGGHRGAANSLQRLKHPFTGGSSPVGAFRTQPIDYLGLRRLAQIGRPRRQPQHRA